LSKARLLVDGRATCQRLVIRVTRVANTTSSKSKTLKPTIDLSFLYDTIGDPDHPVIEAEELLEQIPEMITDFEDQLTNCRRQ